MSGLCSSIATITPQVLPSKPKLSRSYPMALMVSRAIGRDVDVLAGGDLTGHDAQPGGEQRLAGHAAGRIDGEDGVEDGVGHLVGDLVRMALGDRFRGEGPAGSRVLLWVVLATGRGGA